MTLVWAGVARRSMFAIRSASYGRQTVLLLVGIFIRCTDGVMRTRRLCHAYSDNSGNYQQIFSDNRKHV